MFCIKCECKLEESNELYIELRDNEENCLKSTGPFCSNCTEHLHEEVEGYRIYG